MGERDRKMEWILRQLESKERLAFLCTFSEVLSQFCHLYDSKLNSFFFVFVFFSEKLQ